MQAAFRVQANFHFVEAPFSDDLLKHHRHTHRSVESKIQTDGSPNPSLCGKQRGCGNPSPLPNPLPRGEGIGLQAAFKVQAIFNFVEAPFSDDLSVFSAQAL